MKIISIKNWDEVPKDYTGIVECPITLQTHWYLNGHCHREDGPAVEYKNGTKQWYLNGKCHREGGPAIEYPDGTKWWYLNGLPHREDGPAVEWANGGKDWCLNGERHRVDGPAVEKADGYKAWYLNSEIVFAEYSSYEKLSETPPYQHFVFFRELPNGKTSVKPIFFRFSIFDEILLIEKDVEQIIPPFKEPFLFKKYLSSDGVLFFPQQTFEETE